MICYECDKCGRPMSEADQRRFVLKIELFAAASRVDLDTQQNAGDPKTQLNDLIKQLSDANPDDVEDETFRAFQFDLCDNCRKKFLANPLR